MMSETSRSPEAITCATTGRAQPPQPASCLRSSESPSYARHAGAIIDTAARTRLTMLFIGSLRDGRATGAMPPSLEKI